MKTTGIASYFRTALALFLVSVTAAAQLPSSDGDRDATLQRRLMGHLSFIASDELEGRDTPSRGLDIAARYIAAHLTRCGWTPAGDSGSFFQRIALRRTRAVAERSFITVNGRRFGYGGGFIAPPVPFSGADLPAVYAGHGYMVRSKNIDPYKGLDLKGSVLIVSGGYPSGVGPSDFKGTSGVDFETPSGAARAHGAAAVIVIPASSALTQWEKNRKRYAERGEHVVPALDGTPAAPVSITASSALVDALFAGESLPVASLASESAADSVAPFRLSSALRLGITLSVETDTQYTSNIVARLPGADAVLSSEHVALSAHYDHVGTGTPVNGDSIYNGADDDGSGAAALLALAESFADAPRPKRSLLFIWHTGEEKGLWGSKYFTRFPTVPLSTVTTLVNMDMIGRSRTERTPERSRNDVSASDEIFVIGSRMQSAELGRLVEESNRSASSLRLNYRFDSPDDPQRLYDRSDHINYAKKGVPIVFFFDGLHEDYHSVDDETDRIDAVKYEKVVRTVRALAARLANRTHRPAVERQEPNSGME